MQEIARHSNINRTTLKHIKSLMSGIFKHAKRQGALNGVNPMQDVSIPKAPEGRETYAYSLEEITRMLMVVPEPAATIIAAAAFTGARRGEIAGLLWENYNGHEIKVTQSVWRGHNSEPKTRRSRSSIPVIAPLARMLDRHGSESSVRTSGLIFMNARGGVICLEDLARRVVRPALEKAGIDWHGWHSFRRGLATNLYRLGVPDKSIQGILRHSNVSTTMNSYVKSVSADAVAAMKMLESVCTKHAQGNAQASALVM
jgi:integrase